MYENIKITRFDELLIVIIEIDFEVIEQTKFSVRNHQDFN